jgi:hypothetical protein
MSQRGVERVIGRLVTDEGFRNRFGEDPLLALAEALRCGVELTELEIQALATLDRLDLERLAGTLDPRIQKICIHGVRQ